MPYEKCGGEVRCIADEVPFDIPDTWEWVRLMDVCRYIQRGKSPKYSLIKKYPVVAQKCNQWSGFSIEKAQFIEPGSISSYADERILQDGDLMWNSTGLGTLGRIAIYKSALNPYELAVADSHVTVIRPLTEYVLSDYLYFYFASPSVQNVIESQADGTTKQKELATTTVKAYFVPIPPLNEQYRILKKILEVIPAIGAYDGVYTSSTRLQERFPEQLKKSILQMAVQGKLVPQDPADEPASVLLERIREEKTQLVKEGKIKKDKHESVIFRRDNSHYEKLDGVERCIDDEIPFDIPEKWEWVRLSHICSSIADGDHQPPPQVVSGIPFLVISDISSGIINFSKTRYVPALYYEKLLPMRRPQKGDILFTVTGSVGIVVPVDSDRTFCFQRHIALLKPLYVETAFLSEWLRAPLVYEQCREKATGTAQKTVGISSLKDLLIPLPPVKEQKRIVEGINTIINTIKNL